MKCPSCEFGILEEEDNGTDVWGECGSCGARYGTKLCRIDLEYNGFLCLVCHEKESLEGNCTNNECPRASTQKTLDLIEKGFFMRKTNWNKQKEDER